MQDTFRLTVLKALSSALAEITTANGYQHDLDESRIHRGRLVLDDNDEIPAIAINEKPVFSESLEPPRGGTTIQTKLELLIQGFADDDRKNPADPAYRLLGDVQKRLAQEGARSDGYDVLGFGEKVEISVGQGIVRPPDAVVSDTAFFWLPVTLTFGENLKNPFA